MNSPSPARLELLAPAKDLDCGLAAISHGADAVYIGGPAFGARRAAGNPIEDIAKLCREAHRYRARVYLTLNTILFDHELAEAEQIARQAWEAGVDALIVQDLAFMQLDMPPLALHASTQMHNFTPEHVKFLEDVGFSRAVLARELSLDQIAAIHQACPAIELEAFVHGALCVSLSGRCYLSAELGGRSANRGECGQPCRLPFNLKDAGGALIRKQQHLLCLKDLERAAWLEQMADAGVRSFKIEGRLKDEAYVKNVTAYYRQRLDELLARRPEYAQASLGQVSLNFVPDPAKSFQRGATAYGLNGRFDGIAAASPKSTGEFIGTVTRSRQNWFNLISPERKLRRINPGDGLCFFDDKGELKGIQVSKTDEGRIYGRFSLSGLKPGMQIYRNRDHKFLKQLEGQTAERRIGVNLVFGETPQGFCLSATSADGVTAAAELVAEKLPAENPDSALETIRRQLLKLGDTIYTAEDVAISCAACFLRAGELNQLRRDLIENLEAARAAAYERPSRKPAPAPQASYPITELDYSYNVANSAAREFYETHGVKTSAPAFELGGAPADAVLMTTASAAN